MENQEIKKYLIALGVPKILWNWSIGDTHDAPSDEIKEVGKKIKTTLQEGYSFRIKLRSDIYSAQLAVYLLKCALKEDFIRVGYTNPQSLADMYADSWEGSEAYAEYLA